MADSIQKKLRIQIAIHAFAYEVMNDPLISDDKFDQLALLVDVNIPTDRGDLDTWFKEMYDPSTGAWIYNHPEYARIGILYQSCANYRSRINAK